METVTAAHSPGSSPAPDQSEPDLRAQIAALTARVAELEEGLKQVPFAQADFFLSETDRARGPRPGRLCPVR